MRGSFRHDLRHPGAYGPPAGHRQSARDAGARHLPRDLPDDGPQSEGEATRRHAEPECWREYARFEHLDGTTGKRRAASRFRHGRWVVVADHGSSAEETQAVERLRLAV